MIKTKTDITKGTSEAAIFAWLWDKDEAKLSPQLAGHILQLRLSAEDEAKMHELAVKNQEGRISALELEALDNYIKVGDLLAILQSKARTLLKSKTK